MSNTLLTRKNSPFCGVFYLLLQKMVEHVKTFFIAQLKPSLSRQEDSDMLTPLRNCVTQLPLLVRWTESYSKLTMKILRERLHDFLLVSLLQTLSKNLSIGSASYINIYVLILICKCSHGDFNSYDVFSSNFNVHYVALTMD